MLVEISNKVRLAFDRSKADYKKPRVSQAQRPHAGNKNVLEEMKPPKKNRGLAFTKAKL